MPTAPLFTRLADLGFRLDGDAFSALCKHTSKSRHSFVQGLEQLLELERRERDGRNLARCLRHATLGTVAALDTFEWNHPRSINQACYEKPVAA